MQLLCVDEPDLKVSRIAVGELSDGRVQFEFHYLVGRAGRVEYFVEPHPVSLFEDGDNIAAFEKASLPVAHDPEGLEGRSLFVAVSPT